MATVSMHSASAFLFPRLLLLPLTLGFWHCAMAAACQRPPVIFNFGDSNSDTGGLAAGLGFPVDLPNGREYFRRPTGRLCDGRLVIDFLCQSLNASLLNPYLDSLAGSRFRNGANFAVIGSSTLPRNLPFSLSIQVMQFLHFKTRALELAASGLGDLLVSDDGFRGALYMVDIGQNDLADSFDKKLSYVQVVRRIPAVLANIESAVKTLYNEGGRKFWVHNTGPLGCLPQKLSMAKQKDLDQHGCISRYNSAAQLFNEGLEHVCQDLRIKLKDATIVYTDIYAIKYDLIANSTKHGFSDPLMACCGSGGPPYNYNIRTPCGQPGSQACAEGTRRISWDGIHYTEAANLAVASRVLSMKHSTPPTPFAFFCREA